ncbi:hypothetical protein AYI69_g8623 [Smittium culicis]|uniref:CCHC-type domain-containing protein n=1 Tax=Smittium culicis TaxID=133412 RepID=A0A1R1XIC4_9FUNG|nr:hypothetical protein AYI69_g8623 [Smittium culicis]
MYQTEKLEEDITVVNIPNLGDVDILTLLDLIKETLEPISEIIDISALCRKGLTEFLPYGVKILFKKKSAESIIPSFLDYEYGRINIFYGGCKEACSYCKQEGHWKSNCEFLRNKSRKVSKKVQNSTRNQTDEQAMDTPEDSVEHNSQPEADEPSNVDQEPPKPLVSEQRRVPINHGKNNSENIGNCDANISTEKKYKKYIIPRTPVSEGSYGYNTPTELEIMAEKSRNNQITEAQYIKFEKKYFAENFSESAAEINYSSDSPDHTDQDMDFE